MNYNRAVLFLYLSINHYQFFFIPIRYINTRFRSSISYFYKYVNAVFNFPNSITITNTNMKIIICSEHTLCICVVIRSITTIALIGQYYLNHSLSEFSTSLIRLVVSGNLPGPFNLITSYLIRLYCSRYFQSLARNSIHIPPKFVPSAVSLIFLRVSKFNFATIASISASV